MEADPAAGKVLRDRRKALRLKQGHVAEQAGISISLLSMIESGQRSATREVLSKIKDALGIVALLDMEPVSPPAPADLAAKLGGVLLAVAEMPIGKASRIMGVSAGDIRRALRVLDEGMVRWGIRVVDDGQVARMLPDHQLNDLLRQFTAPKDLPALTKRLSEVLAIAVGYGEVTHKAVEWVRGVDSHEALGELVEDGYLAVRIDEEATGSPRMYRPTIWALEKVGAQTVEQLQAMARERTLPK